ncbi:MAG: trigger factor [Bryobacterales bacterium]|nr:trigger factor [Bryobacterales bacterium]
MAEADTCRRELEFTVEWDDVEKDVAQVVNGFRRQARLPGFRPGKAPAALVRSRYWKDIKEEVLKNLLPRVFWDKAREEGLKVVGSPNLTDLHFENGEPVKFQTEFDIYPEFELGEYRRIEVPYSEPEVFDDEVNHELEHLREQNASYRNLDPRPLADGDIAVLKLTGEPLDGGPKVEQNEMMITIGEAETLPEFSENLRGMSPGDTAEFNVKYPDDYGTEKLAGKTLAFCAEVLEMREKELPELDDDFAQEAGEYSSLEELKNQIHEAIGAHRRRTATGEAKNKLMDVLIDRHRFPVPETMVDRQIATRAERRLRALEEQGVDSSELDLDWRQIREREKPLAERDVCASLILERIADEEGIQVGSDELDEPIRQYAERQKKSVSAARAELVENGTLDRVRSQMRNDKTLDFLFDEAQKVDAPAEAGSGESGN